MHCIVTMFPAPTCQIAADTELRDLRRWFTLKAQQLHLDEQLVALEHARAFLLSHPQHDRLAAAYGLKLSRVDGTTYYYEHDKDLERKRLRVQVLKEQLQDGQAAFREACRLGKRQVDVDFIPARRLRLELDACAVERERG